MPAHTLEYVDILPPLGFIRELHADAAYAPEPLQRDGYKQGLKERKYIGKFFFLSI